MKKQTSIIISLVSFALLAYVWFLVGRTKADAQTTTNAADSTVSADLLKMQMFNQAYEDVSISESVIELLDSGQIEDARHMLHIHQDGAIIELDSVPGSPNLSAKEMAALRDLNASMQSSQGSMREVANRILARVARQRTEHPWTYKGRLPQTTNTEAEAKLEAILKRATESQK